MPGGSTQFVREVVATIQTRAATATNNTTADLPSTTASTPPPEAEEAEQQQSRPRKKPRRWMSLLSAEQEPEQRGRFSDGQFGSTISLQKRKRAPSAATTTTTTESDAPPPATTTESDTPPLPTNQKALAILNQDYFDSPEANILFGLEKEQGREEMTAEEVSVRTTIQQRIERLTEAFSTPNGWKSVLEDRDATETCSPFQIYDLQIKCRYTAIALWIALRKMGRGPG